MDHFVLQPATEHLDEDGVKLWNLREQKRVRQCKAGLNKNWRKAVGFFIPQSSQNAPGAATASASTQEPAVMGCVAMRTFTSRENYAQVNVAKYGQLQEVYGKNKRAISERLELFHGADVNRISDGRANRLVVGNRLRVEIDAFACNAALVTEKRINEEEFGRARQDNEVAMLEQEFERRKLRCSINPYFFLA